MRFTLSVYFRVFTYKVKRTIYILPSELNVFVGQNPFGWSFYFLGNSEGLGCRVIRDHTPPPQGISRKQSPRRNTPPIWYNFRAVFVFVKENEHQKAHFTVFRRRPLSLPGLFRRSAL